MIYKHKYYILTISVVLLLCNLGSYAQTVSINQPYKDTLLCRGGKFDLSYTVNTTTGSFKNNNIFKIVLSDFNGTFSTFSPVIGQGYGTNSNTVTCTIPTGTPPGTQYRIRIVADSPSYTSPDNGINIRVSYYPNITGITVNGPVCVGNTLNFGVTSTTLNVSYAWEGPGGYTSNIQNAILTNASLTHNNVFTAKVTAYGCTIEDTIRPIVSPPPAKPVANTNSPVCERGDLGFASHSTTPNVSYIWHDLSGTPLSNWDNFIIKNAKPSNSGMYIVTAKIGTCTAKDTIYGLVKPAPDTALLAYNAPLCAGDTLKLSSTPPQSGLIYKWIGPGGFTSSIQNPIVPNVPKSYEGEYQLVLESNSCESLPSKMYVSIGATITILDIIGDTALCPGDTLALTTRGGAGIYQWKGPNDFNYFGGAIFRPNITAKDGGEYILTLSNNGCVSKPSKIFIDIPDIKKPIVSHNSPLCAGETLQFTIKETLGGTYTWTGVNNFSSTDAAPSIPNVQLIHAGSYSVTTNYRFCTENATANIAVKPLPVITDIGYNGPLCENELIQIHSSTNVPGTEYSWTGPGNFNSNIPNPSFSINSTTQGIYYLTITKDGCDGTPSSVTVDMIKGPRPPLPTNNSIIDEGQILRLFAGGRHTGTSFLWTGPDGFTSTDGDPVIEDATVVHAGTYKVVANYNGCTKTAETQVKVRSQSSISVELYPNPNDGKFTISGIISDNNTYKFTIANMLERVVHTGTITPTNKKFKQEIDVRFLPNGMYILQAGDKSLKFVKQQ